ncbi:NAD(P)H-dependent oxidoreductase subunit E [bacterium]|nr:NAD(P)H-dependent oxidoreductase subunit E [bacterium]
MNFAPIIIMNVILLVITILLSIADKFLVTYGKCKITVTQEDEHKEFVVEGGNYLHSELISHGYHIQASCGGKATCGYCKVMVKSGGGSMLPTEEVFMSKEEKKAGTRLSCQVKVKEDIEIQIPDFFSTVRNIVKNQMYDPKVDWQFITDVQGESLPALKKIKVEQNQQDTVLDIINQYRDLEGPLVPVLQKVNDTFNYLPENLLHYIAEELDIPKSHVYRIATFYNAFSLKPKGKYKIAICMGTACHVKGAAGLMETFENELSINEGETTEDLLFSLEGVRCIGCCGLAPVLLVNEDVHGLVTKDRVPQIIEMYRKKEI